MVQSFRCFGALSVRASDPCSLPWKPLTLFQAFPAHTRYLFANTPRL